MDHPSQQKECGRPETGGGGSQHHDHAAEQEQAAIEIEASVSLQMVLSQLGQLTAQITALQSQITQLRNEKEAGESSESEK